MMTKISATVYSYKNKNLLSVVKNIIDNTRSEISITVIDQHPIDRKSTFLFDNVEYEHVFWDLQDSPCVYKDAAISKADGEYTLILSDDVMLNPGWDKELISFIDSVGERTVLSGSGALRLHQKDKFSFAAEYIPVGSFTKTSWIDKNFIFAKSETLRTARYPAFLKYFGEDEAYGLELWKEQIDVYSVPANIYTDLKARTIENLYVPYSRDHNYNTVIDQLLEHKDFLSLHGIDSSSLFRLPYENNDVMYNPNELEFRGIDGKKFLANTKAIY